MVYPIKFIIAKVQTSEQNTKLALIFYSERSISSRFISKYKKALPKSLANNIFTLYLKNKKNLLYLHKLRILQIL